MADENQELYHIVTYNDNNVDKNKFSPSKGVIRTVYVINFNTSTRQVVLKIRKTGRLRKYLVRKRREEPSEEELLKQSKTNRTKKILIPRPPIDPSTLKCACGDLCKISVSHTEKNPDREYAHCASRRCSYWEWCNETHLICLCNKPAPRIEAKDNALSKNKGRLFLACHNHKEKNGCGYFMWLDDPIVEACLSPDWGESFMTVEEALHAIIKHYSDPPSRDPIPKEILSTLSAECSHIA